MSGEQRGGVQGSCSGLIRNDREFGFYPGVNEKLSSNFEQKKRLDLYYIKVPFSNVEHRSTEGQQEITCKAGRPVLEGRPTGPVSVAVCLKRQRR